MTTVDAISAINDILKPIRERRLVATGYDYQVDRPTEPWRGTYRLALPRRITITIDVAPGTVKPGRHD